ncbi:hypothetical protein KEI92_001516 [Staphylococcus pseudintermedius]|nr:hypothetical protein [Staphylococcus pseudintermedius]
MAVYRDDELNWNEFSKDTIKSVHGDMYYYRNLYEGNHHEIFPRAKELIENGEIIDVYSASGDSTTSKNVRTPYIMLNMCRIIVDIPSLLVSRSIGQFKTNYPRTSKTVADQQESNENNTNDNEQEIELIEGTETDDINGQITDPQQELIEQIIKNSKINHAMNISQLQIDGGIVAVPSIKNNQISIEFKERNIYYSHVDGLGVDLVYELEPTAEEMENSISYIHVYTERERERSLVTMDRLYLRSDDGTLEQVDDPLLIQEKLKMAPNELTKEFKGRQRVLVCYLANEPTFNNRLGKSTLKGLDGKQEEINWSLTRSAQTFERNGKPRISVSKQTMDALKNIALDMYGDENKIDHRSLEITEIDTDTGQSIQIHQIDTTKIGDMTYIKDIVRAMLAETQTSENAVEIVKRESSNAQSGVAKFYDLMVSIIKSEKIRDEYVEFLKDVIESTLWLANYTDSSVIIERPNIMFKDMLPQPKQEVSTDNITKYQAGAQSLEETVRQNNPDKSEEWIDEEIERIRSDKTSTDSLAIDRGNQTLQNFLNNRDEEGNPLDEFGNPINNNQDEEQDE